MGFSRTFKILFHWIITLVSRAFLGFLSLDCYVRFSRTFRISFIGLLRLYLAYFQDFLHWTVAFVSRARLELSFIGLLRLYLAHFQDSLSLDCCVCISRTFRIPYHLYHLYVFTLVSRAVLGILFIRLLPQYLLGFLFYAIVMLVCRALLGCSFIGLLREYTVHFQDSLSLDCCVFRALLGFFFIGFLHQYFAHFKDFLSLDCYLCISSTFRILFHWIVTFVSRALLGFSFIGLLRQYPAHFWDALPLDCCVCISRTFRIPYHQIITLVYHINCGVLQGFSALSKAVKTHVKKYRIQCQWPISYLHGTRLWRHSVRLMNERQGLYDSQYKLFAGAFSNHGG